MSSHPTRAPEADDPDDLVGDLGGSERRSRRGRGGVTVTLLLLLLGGILAAGYWWAHDRAGTTVPAGTTVRGVDIGGLEPAEAVATLRRELEPRQGDPIKVVVDDQRAEVDWSEAGYALDAAATVEQAGAGTSWSPVRLWRHWFGGGAIAPVVTVDEERWAATLKRLGRSIDEKPVDAEVAWRRTTRGVTARVTESRVGQGLDAEAARARLVRAFLTPGPVELATLPRQPDVTDAEVAKLQEEFVRPALSGPVRLELGRGREVLARPRVYTRAITFERRDGTLVPRLQPRKLVRALAPAVRRIGDTPRDARFVLRNGRPRVVPARVGLSLDRRDLAAKFLDVVAAPRGQRSVQVDTVVARPDLTTKEARALGIRERVSTWTTYFPYAEYRNVNLPRAAELIDGTVLEPGETFSLNGTVGERTAANGFTKGYVIKDGIFREDFGGGVSQIATTTFNAMFFAGLEDVEHRPHSVYIDRYPVGREATVVWGSLDLRFKNTTPHGVLIKADVTRSTPSSSGVVTVSMYSTKYWDIGTSVGPRTAPTQPERRVLRDPDCEPADGLPGFTVDVYRYFKREGRSEVVRTERFHTVYIPSDTVVCESG